MDVWTWFMLAAGALLAACYFGSRCGTRSNDEPAESPVDLLRRIGACEPCIKWAAEHGGTIEELVRDCPEHSWLVWYATRTLPDHALRKFAVECAERALVAYEAVYDDGRLRESLEIARRRSEEHGWGNLRDPRKVREEIMEAFPSVGLCYVRDARAAYAVSSVQDACDAVVYGRIYRTSLEDATSNAARYARTVATGSWAGWADEREWQAQRLRELLEEGSS